MDSVPLEVASPSDTGIAFQTPPAELATKSILIRQPPARRSLPKRPLLIRDFKKILHGGDYNPDQWLHAPEVIDEDFRLMKLAGCNAFSIGIFGWTSYERTEGEFCFDWLDRILDRMAEAGNKVILATPSGAKPAWMSKKYPEIRRVNATDWREPHWHRHNHCWSSPVYREKVRIINTRLAERYSGHPALAMWHVSNELGNDDLAGQCHCGLCLGNWRRWLEEKYGTIEKLNRAWWASFWSHEFTAWDEIDPRDWSMDGLSIDWLRFRNWQIQDWYDFEAGTLRPFTPHIPITTNFMGLLSWINYAEMAAKVDVIMDDQYPAYEIDDPGLIRSAVLISFKNNLYRCFKPEKPWMLIESCPDAPQWKSRMRPKPAALHQCEMIQALGHGAEGTCYFQWRKGLGSREKLSGAVVDHSGREDGRVFRGVAELSDHYSRLAPILGSVTWAQVGIVYDWEARWGLENSDGAAGKNGAYDAVACAHYQPFWEQGINVDVFDSSHDFASYRLLILPQLWMLKPGVAERLRVFVESGGILVATCYLGICDESNLCFTGGWPGGGLMDLFGIWNEEYDTLPAERRISLALAESNPLGLKGDFEAKELCAILHNTDADVVATHREGLFAGGPAITVKHHGSGQAWYVGARLEPDSLRAFHRTFIERLALEKSVDAELPCGVTAQSRNGKDADFVFFQNFTPHSKTVPLGSLIGRDLISGGMVSGTIELPPAGSTVIAAERRPPVW